MELSGFSKSKTQVALSNVANKRKASTPLLSTLFKYTKPSKTTAVELVYDTATGKILPLGDRANTNAKAEGNTIGKKTRNGKILNAMHITAFADIDSDDVQDIPEPTDAASLETFESYTAGEIEAIEQALEATREFHALGAILGKVVDSDGSKIYDLYDLFGLTKVKVTIDSTELAEVTGLTEILMDAKSKAKKKLKGKNIKGFVMFCGDEAFKDFGFAKDTETAFKNNKLKYVVDGFSDGFNFQSIDFVEYNGSIGDKDFIETNDAVLVPIVDGLCCITATPGKGTDHVNKKGQKTFITTKELDHNAGIELKGQSNYVAYTEVPDSIQHFTLTPPPPAA